MMASVAVLRFVMVVDDAKHRMNETRVRDKIHLARRRGRRFANLTILFLIKHFETPGESMIVLVR